MFQNCVFVSWNHGCGIIAENLSMLESLLQNLSCGIIAVETLLWRHLEGIWRHLEASGRHLGMHIKASGDMQEAPGRHPEVKCVKTMLFFYEKSYAQPFRVHRRDPTLTKSAACVQKLAGDLSTPCPVRLMDSLLGRQNPNR